MEIPKEIVDRVKNPSIEDHKDFRLARINYKRRVLDRAVRKYSDRAVPINSKEINKICKKHGFIIH